MFGSVLQLDPHFSKLSNDVILDIHQLNVWTIKLFKVIELEVRTFDAEWMWWFQRRKKISSLGIANLIVNISGLEVVGLTIRLWV